MSVRYYSSGRDLWEFGGWDNIRIYRDDGRFNPYLHVATIENKASVTIVWPYTPVDEWDQFSQCVQEAINKLKTEEPK